MSLPRKRAGGPRTTGTRGDWDITAAAPAKKPKSPAKARSSLKPSKGLDRGKPLERGKPIDRGTTPIPRVSAKAKERRPERDAVRKATCALAHYGGCVGPVDTHEIVRRSQMSEAAYMGDVTIGACRHHHDWDTYKLFAEWIGIRIPVDFYKQDPVGTVDEAARRRANPLGVPSWWSPADEADWRANAAHYPSPESA